MSALDIQRTKIILVSPSYGIWHQGRETNVSELMAIAVVSIDKLLILFYITNM